MSQPSISEKFSCFYMDKLTHSYASLLLLHLESLKCAQIIFRLLFIFYFILINEHAKTRSERRNTFLAVQTKISLSFRQSS